MNRQESKVVKRRFSLEGDFMLYDSNDLLYGFMRTISTAYPDKAEGKHNSKKWNEYLPKNTFRKNKKLIADICGCSTRTIDNNLKRLIEKGLVCEEGLLDKNGEEQAIYTFPFDYDGSYQMADKRVIEYLVNTRSTQAIRVYIYLLNKSQWKDDYVFTIGELKMALGYSSSTKTAERVIKDILVSLQKEGIIKYKKFYANIYLDEKTIPVERMMLKKVISTGAELPAF